MFSGTSRTALALSGLILLGAAACSGPGADPQPRDPGVLRVCADPNNLPFSNQAGEGFENRVAEILARELEASLEYTWWAQRRGFVRNTLNAGLCDVLIGVPAGFDPVLTTRPYYRSTYVFLSRADAALSIRSLDDERLRRLRIGVHLVGDDGANPPAAHALARRGVVGNLVGFSIYGNYADPNPPARIVDAVADGTIDVAIVWGPFAGYFGRRARVPLEMHPVPSDAADAPQVFAYAISLGVRRSDRGLRQRLDDFVARRGSDIRRILEDYGVPLVQGDTPAPGEEPVAERR